MSNFNSLFNELNTIAKQAAPKTNTNPETVDNKIAKDEINKLTDLANTAGQMYPTDPVGKFQYWKNNTDISTLSNEAKNKYWKTYVDMHPEGMVGAKRDFVDITKRELEFIDSSVNKEFYLKERLEYVPEWARTELDPILAELSTTIANSNYSKAQQVYMKDLDLRINRFAVLAQLDPDVPSTTHTSDAVKLEQLNLLELAKVEQGRIGVFSETNQFIPAYFLKDRKQVFKEDRFVEPSLEEQSVVRSLAPTIIKKAIDGNLAFNRNRISRDERDSSTLAAEYLLSGSFQPDQWNTAFAMLPDKKMEDKLVLGLRGEISAGRIKSEKDLAQAIFRTLEKYGSYLQENKE